MTARLTHGKLGLTLPAVLKPATAAAVGIGLIVVGLFRLLGTMKRRQPLMRFRSTVLSQQSEPLRNRRIPLSLVNSARAKISALMQGKLPTLLLKPSKWLLRRFPKPTKAR